MIQMMRALGATAVVVASCLGGQAVAQTKQLTLCWAAWDPANALGGAFERLHRQNRH